MWKFYRMLFILFLVGMVAACAGTEISNEEQEFADHGPVDAVPPGHEKPEGDLPGLSWSGNTSLLTDTETYWPAPDLEKPGYLQTVVDPVFGSKLTRIVGDPDTKMDMLPNNYYVWGTTARHNYSKDPVWNADQSLMVLKFNMNESGRTPPRSPGMIFLDGATYETKFGRSPGFTEARWHPTDPELMIYVAGNAIGYWNPVTNERQEITRFEGIKEAYFGPWEGNISDDGRHVVIQSGDKVFAYNLVEDIRYPDIDWEPEGKVLDFATISPLGNYVVVTAVVGDNPYYTRIYTKEGELIQEWDELWTPTHYDLAVDTDGSEVVVGSSRSEPHRYKVIKRRLHDGETTVVATGGFASHTSARNLKRTGWVYVTFSDRDKDGLAYKNEVVAVKLDGSRVERIAHLRTNNHTYWAEAQASVSPDGLRVVFASNWGVDDNPNQAFVADFSHFR